MPTRFHFNSVTSAPVSPAYSAAWNITAGAGSRKACSVVGVNNDLATGSGFAETDAGVVNVLARQFTSTDQFAVAHTITGNVTAVIPCYEGNGNADGFLQLIIKIVSADGATVRGVVYAGSALTSVTSTVGAVNQEMSIGLAAQETRIIPAQSVSSVDAQVGDRVCIEIGWRAANLQTTSRNAFFRYGYVAAAADFALTAGIPVADGLTNDFNSWVEFSDDLFSEAPPTQGQLNSIGFGTQICTYQDPLIKEASGIVASRIHANTVYVHNDSGDTNRIFMVNTQTGATSAILTIDGATHVDWEDIAYYNGKIVIADVGNNAGTRTNQCLYAFSEPSVVTTQNVTAVKYPITVASPGTARDTETFMINPVTGETFLYMKANATVSSSGLYQGPDFADLTISSANVFTQIDNFNLHQVTAGDWSANGNYYVLSTNGSDPVFSGNTGGMYVFGPDHVEVGRWQGNATTPLNPSESICWSIDGNYIYRSHDGGGDANMPIFRYPVSYTEFEAGPLTANAGLDLIDVGPLNTVILSGVPSGGSGNYTYSWSQISGSPTVTLNTTGSNTLFVAPGKVTGMTLGFRFQVNDGVTSDTDDVLVTVLNHNEFMINAAGVLVGYRSDTAVSE